jgi:hypothetical protein
LITQKGGRRNLITQKGGRRNLITQKGGRRNLITQKGGRRNATSFRLNCRYPSQAPGNQPSARSSLCSPPGTGSPLNS